MKNISIIAVIAFSILFSICAVNAAELSREEYGSKGVKLEWCTEEFHTQGEFHKQITGWMSNDPDGVNTYVYRFIYGGPIWTSDATTSPEIDTSYFMKTKMAPGEKVDHAKSRLSDFVLDATGVPALHDESRWWVSNGEVSYLLIGI